MFLQLPILVMVLATHCHGKDKVLRDSQVPGGQGRREVDHFLSRNLGGYKAIQEGRIKEPSAYGKYVEPVLHAAEHTIRAVSKRNSKEWARAKDQLNTVGKGLHTMDNKYQKAHDAGQKPDYIGKVKKVLQRGVLRG